jgi:hypothetical protein
MKIYETNQTVIDNAKSLAEEKGWELIHVRVFDNNPANDYLKFVLCKRGEGDYCTHLYNTDGGSDGKGFFVEGHYDLSNYRVALDDLYDRK